MCADIDVLFDSILDKCAYLTQYGVQPRYPDEIDIDGHKTKKAVRYANEIKDFAPLVTVREKI